MLLSFGEKSSMPKKGSYTSLFKASHDEVNSIDTNETYKCNGENDIQGTMMGLGRHS